MSKNRQLDLFVALMRAEGFNTLPTALAARIGRERL